MLDILDLDIQIYCRILYIQFRSKSCKRCQRAAVFAGDVGATGVTIFAELFAFFS